MYQEIKKLLKTKELFESSDNRYWDDPYISKNLLQAHLSLHSDNASRNQDFIDQSLLYIESILKEHKLHKIIDYGCGPGLYTKILADKGYEVTGIDFSKRSIDYAIEQSSKVNYRYENYLETKDFELYDFASLIYCDYGSLNDDNRKLLLSNIYNSLKPGAYFLMDAFTVEKFLNFKEQKTFSLKDKSFWLDQEHLEIIYDQTFTNFVSLEKLILIYDTKHKVINRWYQHFTKESLELELTNANFNIISHFKNLKGEKYDLSSETVAFLVQKPF